MKKIITIILIFSILFLGGFFFQTSYYQKVAHKNNIEFVNENLWLKDVSIFDYSFQLVELLFLSITTFISIMIVLLIIILINRKRMENRTKLKDFLLEKYQGLILQYLSSKIVNTKEFKKIARNNFSRQLLIKQIIDVSINLPPESKYKLMKLYLSLGLLKDTRKRLYSYKWHKKVQAFKELSSLNIKKYNNKINKYINSKNDILRIESQISMVKLTDDYKPFNFLGNLTYPFSLWEQITLHELMVQNEMNVPDFSQWLNSSNHTVVMFCLRMIKEYKQIDNYNELEHVLYHENDKVRKLAIQVIGDLELFVLFKNLKKIFKNETYENRLEIIKTMGKRPVKSVLNFLEIVVDSEDDVNIQIEAVKAINNMGTEGEIRLNKMMKSDYKNYNIIIKHVLDNRIN